jgi:propionyl-CoA synthetase
MSSRYHELYSSWKDNPDAFWAEAAREIDWFTPFDKVFAPGQGVYGRWFPGATCNMCHNALDRHVAGGRADQLALIHDSPITDTKRSFTYAQLAGGSGGACRRDLRPGHRQGRPRHHLHADGAGGRHRHARLRAARGRAFGGLRRLRGQGTRHPHRRCHAQGDHHRLLRHRARARRFLQAAARRRHRHGRRHKPERCIVLQREQQGCDLVEGRDIDYADAVAAAKAAGRKVDCVPVAATDPLYVLYTSGTTGQPKGVVRDNGGHMVALKWSMKNQFGIEPGEVFWAASDVGWVVGHSYIVYAPLLHGCTTILFEGKPVGTPDAGTFWRVIAEHGVVALFTAPTAFRAIKGGPEGRVRHPPRPVEIPHAVPRRRARRPRHHPLGRGQAQGAGHRPLVADGDGLADLGNPVGLGMLPVKHGSPGVPMPGYDMAILDDAGHEVAPGTLGNR